MQTSPTIGAIATALAEAQKNFAPIPKDREVTVRMKSGGSYKFKYATLDAIRSATMPALAAQGLAVSQGLSDDYKGLETAVYHTSGEWLKNITPMMIDGERSNQAMGSAQSYARRYGLSSILCVTADEDDDANSADGNHVESATGTAAAGGEFRPSGRQSIPKDAPKGEPKKHPEDPDVATGTRAWCSKTIGALDGMANGDDVKMWKARYDAQLVKLEQAYPDLNKDVMDAFWRAVDRTKRESA